MKNIKKVKEMPKSGQFVGVWEHKGVIWSCTYKWEEDTLKEYSSPGDFWADGVLYEKGEITWFRLVEV